VPINDKRWYPIYAKCVRARHPHLRVRRACRAAGADAPQHVELIDEVCWFFPELKS
jgi:uncharacterized protein